MKFLVVCLALIMFAVACNQPKPVEEQGPHCDPKIEKTPYVERLYCDTVFDDKSYLKIIGDSVGTQVYWGKGDNNQHLKLDTMLDWINPGFLMEPKYKTPNFIGITMGFGCNQHEDILLPLKHNAKVIRIPTSCNINFKTSLAYYPEHTTAEKDIMHIINLESGNKYTYEIPMPDSITCAVMYIDIIDTVYVNKQTNTLHITLCNNQLIKIKNVEWY